MHHIRHLTLPVLCALVVGCATPELEIPISVKTEFLPGVSLSKKEIATVLAVAERAGLTNAVKVSIGATFLMREQYLIHVQSAEEIHGNGITYRALTVHNRQWDDFPGWNSRRMSHSKEKFWASSSEIYSTSFRIHTVGDHTTRVVIHNIDPETADKILAALVAGKVRSADHWKNALTFGNLLFPLGLGGSRKGDRFSFSYPDPDQACSTVVGFTWDGEWIEISGITRPCA